MDDGRRVPSFLVSLHIDRRCVAGEDVLAGRDERKLRRSFVRPSSLHYATIAAKPTTRSVSLYKQPVTNVVFPALLSIRSELFFFLPPNIFVFFHLLLKSPLVCDDATTEPCIFFTRRLSRHRRRCSRRGKLNHLPTRRFLLLFETVQRIRRLFLECISQPSLSLVQSPYHYLWFLSVSDSY